MKIASILFSNLIVTICYFFFSFFRIYSYRDQHEYNFCSVYSFLRPEDFLIKGQSHRINASISVHTFSRRDDKARVLIESTLGRGTRFKPTLCSLDLQRSRAL